MNNENNPYQYDPERQSGSSYNHQDYHSHNENPYDTRDDYSNYGGSPPPPKKRGGGVALGVIVVGLVAVLIFTSIAGVLLFLYKGYDKLVETPPKVVETLPPDKTNPVEPLPSDEPTPSEDVVDPRFNLEDFARPAPQKGKELLSIPEIVEKAKPAVVAIYTNVVIDRGAYFGLVESTVAGSGFIITENGYIVTNAHVIEDARSVIVYLEDERTFEATIVGSDVYADVAVLKVDAEGLPTVPLGDSDQLLVGELAIAIGNPTGNLRGTVTSGIVSALNRDMPESPIPLIQTDAALNSGNSGGALLNAYGEVIGINQLKIVYADSGREEPIQGISFAIPSNAAKTIIESLIRTGKHEWPMMGITVSTVQEELAEQRNLHFPGVVVASVERYGPGSKAGLKAGDVITKMDGKDVTTVRELSDAKNQYNVGDTVVLEVYRGDRVMEISLTFGSSE